MPIKTNATQPGYSLFSSNNNKTQSTRQDNNTSKLRELLSYASAPDAEKIKKSISTLSPQVQAELLKEVSGMYIAASSNEVEESGGVYSPQTNTISLDKYADRNLILHELGHAVHYVKGKDGEYDGYKMEELTDIFEKEVAAFKKKYPNEPALYAMMNPYEMFAECYALLNGSTDESLKILEKEFTKCLNQCKKMIEEIRTLPSEQRVAQSHDLKVGYNKDGVLNERSEIAKDGSDVTKDIYDKDGKGIFLGRTFESETSSHTTTYDGRKTKTVGHEIIDGVRCSYRNDHNSITGEDTTILSNNQNTVAYVTLPTGEKVTMEITKDGMTTYITDPNTPEYTTQMYKDKTGNEIKIKQYPDGRTETTKLN